MLISKKWLSEFVSLPAGITDVDLAKKVTLSTVEVERIIDQAADLEKMVVGLIEKVSAHLNADRLKVCQVNIGKRIVQIICGGTNVREGMKVAVALPGSRVRWHGEGELIQLEKTNIRGETSEGMICAGAEIGIDKSSEKEGEIMEVGSGHAIGTSLAKALGRDDVIFEIEHKSLTNRPDLMGHCGMAREIAALYRVPLTHNKTGKISAPKKDLAPFALSVNIEDSSLCPRYMAVAMDGVRVEPSPDWLRNRLLSCGVRSINNVVDVTNFVMLEMGQPMHAFDAQKIGQEGVNILVRQAKKNETIDCLDEKTYELDQDMLVITDGKSPIAIAGVMGGMKSAVTESTTKIVFESANFSPVSVRKTSMKLGVRSESSARFEKSLDPENCEAALLRAVALLQEICPSARVASNVIDEYPIKAATITISLTAKETGERLGCEIDSAEVKDILSRLGFIVKAKGKVMNITVPSWRATRDISIKEDIFEEVARIWGYDKISSALPSFSIAPPFQDPVRLYARQARHLLSGLGATEVYRYAFVGSRILHIFGFDEQEHLKLANPLAADRPYIVRSLLPNIAETILENHRSFPMVSIFEIDRVFFGEIEGDEDGEGRKLPAQPYHLGMGFLASDNDNPFFELRNQIIALFDGSEVSFLEIKNPASWMHPARCADILIHGKKFGIIAEVAPQTAGQLGIDKRFALAEMNLSQLTQLPAAQKLFSSIPLYPDAKRDLAFVVDHRVVYSKLEQALRNASPLIHDLELFDVYQGQGIEAGKKSMAIHVSFRSLERTLSSNEIEAELGKIRSVLEKQFGAMMRS